MNVVHPGATRTERSDRETEQGVLAGDTVLVPHEALSDTPAFLALPRLRRRFRCTAREAAGLAELFLALDASPASKKYAQVTSPAWAASHGRRPSK